MVGAGIKGISILGKHFSPRLARWQSLIVPKMQQGGLPSIALGITLLSRLNITQTWQRVGLINRRLQNHLNGPYFIRVLVNI